MTQPGIPTSNERFSPGASSIVTGEVPTAFPLRNRRAPGGLIFTTTTRVPGGGAVESLGAAALGAGALGAALAAADAASPDGSALDAAAAVVVSATCGTATALGASGVARGVSVAAVAAAGVWSVTSAVDFWPWLCRYQRPPMITAAITRLTISQRDNELPVFGGGTDTRSGAFCRARSPFACGESARVLENGRLARSSSFSLPLASAPDVPLGSLGSSSLGLAFATGAASWVESATGVSLRGSDGAAGAGTAAGVALALSA